MIRLKLSFVLLASLLWLGFPLATTFAAPQRPNRSTKEFVDMFNERFMTRPPMIKKQILDGLKAFDEQGQEFDFESLKGKHTVIIFGCLT